MDMFDELDRRRIERLQELGRAIDKAKPHDQALARLLVMREEYDVREVQMPELSSWAATEKFWKFWYPDGWLALAGNPSPARRGDLKEGLMVSLAEKLDSLNHDRAAVLAEVGKIWPWAVEPPRIGLLKRLFG